MKSLFGKSQWSTHVHTYFFTAVLFRFWIDICFFCNFGNLFSDETRQTLRTGAVPTLNLPIKSQASKQSDDVPPREYLTLHVDDKAKAYSSFWTRSTKEDNSSIALSMLDGIHHLLTVVQAWGLVCQYKIMVGFFLTTTQFTWRTNVQSDLLRLFHCCHKFKNFSFVLVFPSLMIAKFSILGRHIGSCGTQYQRLLILWTLNHHLQSSFISLTIKVQLFPCVLFYSDS